MATQQMGDVMSEDDDWKRRAIEHDMAAFAERARRHGHAVTVQRGSAVTIVTVRPRERLTPEQVQARWEEVAPRLTEEQIKPGLASVLRIHGKKAVLDAVIALKEYRPDLMSVVSAAVRELGLTRESERAEMRHIDRVWKKVLGPHLQVEHLAPMVAAVRAKGPGVFHAWIARVRKHRPDLVPALLDLLHE